MEGQFIVLDKEKKVVAIVSDSEVIVNDEYQVIFDQKEEYRFIDCGNGVIKVVKEKTPQEIHQEELVKLCSPIIEFLKKQPHPYHTLLIKEEGFELLETKQYIPQAKIQGGLKMNEEMKIKVSAHVGNTEELKKIVAEIREIEKEHNISCTLDVEIG